MGDGAKTARAASALRSRGGVDLAENLARQELAVLVALDEYLPDGWHGTRVANLRQARFRSCSPGGGLAAQAFAVLFEDRLPVLGGEFLKFGLAPGGRKFFRLHPLLAMLPVPQLLPGRVAPGVKPHHRTVVGKGLVLQPRVLAPLRQLPLGLGPIGCGRSPCEVLANPCLGLRIVRKLIPRFLGLLPSPAIEDQSQQPPRRGTLGIDESCQHQVLDALGGEPVGLAPECQLDVRVGVAPHLRAGGLVRVEVRFRRGLVGTGGGKNAATQHQNREHRRLLDLETVTRPPDR